MTLTTTNGDSSLWAALVAAQAEMRDPFKDASNPHFKSRFVTLKSVLDSVRPCLHKHGLVLTQHVDFDADRIWVDSRITHKSGQSTTCRVPVIVVKDRDPQAMGSAITYARRYGAAAICGVAPSDDDDDGEAAAAPPRQQSAAPKPKAASKGPVANAVSKAFASALEPFELVEHAVQAIRESSTADDLAAIGKRVAVSKFEGEDKAIARGAYLAQQHKLENA